MTSNKHKVEIIQNFSYYLFSAKPICLQILEPFFESLHRDIDKEDRHQTSDHRFYERRKSGHSERYTNYTTNKYIYINLAKTQIHEKEFQ